MSAVGQDITIDVPAGSLEHFRVMLNEQLLGDAELLRDCLAGREDPERRLEVSDRLRFVRSLAEGVGLPVPHASNPPLRARSKALAKLAYLVHYCVQLC
jgi:hypothetical protein